MKFICPGTILRVILFASIAGCRKIEHTTLCDGSLLSNVAQKKREELPVVDVSIPLGVSQLDWEQSRDHQYTITYTNPFIPNVIQDFYELDMDRLGWRLLTKIEAQSHTLLLFDKPSSWCTIVVYKPGATAISTVAIFVGPKTPV